MTKFRSSLLSSSLFSILGLVVACGSSGDDTNTKGNTGSGASTNVSIPGSGGGGLTGGGGTPGANIGGTPGGDTGGAPGGDTGGTAGSGGALGSNTGGAPSGDTGGTAGSGGAVEAPTGSIDFSPLATSFQGSLEVALSTELTGDIHYTVDGTVPTSSSPTYSAPIQLSATTQIRAIVLAGTTTMGDPGSAVYLALGSAITSDIPLIVIDNYVAGPVVEESAGFGQESDRPFFDATFMSFAVKADGIASLADTPDVATRAGFHVRGQSSATFDKTPYRLELRDNDDDDKKFPLLGMPTQSDWVLRGPYADKSLIRDAIFYGLGTDMGMQSPKFVIAEFYLNTDNATVDESDYMGVYLIAETIKNAKGRLDLAQLDETDTDLPDINGGYIFKFEWMAAEEPIIPCTGAEDTCWADLEVYDPLPINTPQLDWLSGYVHEFHAALHSDSWLDASTGYARYMERASFVDQLIINELSREMDSYVRSAYFHKDRDGLLVAGPLWDYNLSFGIGGFFGNSNTAGWQYIQNCSDDDVVMQADLDLGGATEPDPNPGVPGGGIQKRTPGNNWFLRMMDDPAFVAEVKARWQELRAGILSDTALDQRVTDLSAPLTNAAARNFQKWDVLGTDAIGVGFKTDISATWEEQITFLRTWMTGRVAWLDTQWGQ